MLEDRDWTDGYLRENRRRLGVSYQLVAGTAGGARRGLYCKGSCMGLYCRAHVLVFCIGVRRGLYFRGVHMIVLPGCMCGTVLRAEVKDSIRMLGVQEEEGMHVSILRGGTCSNGTAGSTCRAVLRVDTCVA